MAEVIAAANDTEYGLAAGIWTRDIGVAHRMAKKMKSGTVWLNCQLIADRSMPFGGYKQSGWGRENGLEGLDAFLQTKSVFAAI
jgi:acyl-CoA reductase-like NAD-dependent aldehyde dehydrogenase